MIDQIESIDTVLNATAESLDPTVTPPLSSSTQAQESGDVYTMYQVLLTVVRDGFDTIKVRSDELVCALTVTVPFFGEVTLFNYTVKGTETRQKLLEYKESLGVSLVLPTLQAIFVVLDES